MAKVDERATGIVKSVMPAVRVFVLPGALDPLEYFAEAIKLDLSVSQVHTLQPALSSLPSALLLISATHEMKQHAAMSQRATQISDRKVSGTTLTFPTDVAKLAATRSKTSVLLATSARPSSPIFSAMNWSPSSMAAM